MSKLLENGSFKILSVPSQSCLTTQDYAVTIPVTLTQDVSCILQSSREKTGLYSGSDCIFLHCNLTKKYIFPLHKMVVILKQHK